MSRRRSNDLVLLPLGGAGEIGMNCYAYGIGPEDAREWLMVDLGVKFGEESEPGIDVVLPDLSFIEAEGRRALHGLVLTHAHEDHIGAVPWLWPRLKCPVYCTPFTAALLTNKLREKGLDETVPLKIRNIGDRFKLGPFDCEFVAVTHSIPEPTALMIRTAQGKVLHSGDWKIDRAPVVGADFDEARMRVLADEGIDALVCDSTNVLREGHSPSESDVADTLMEIVKGAKGRVAITTFASHVGRLSSAIKAARAAGREVLVVGRAMRNTIEAARACGYLKEAGTFLEEEAFGYLPRDKALLLCTGSQGEPRAALARIAEDNHPHVALDEDDLVVFSSKTIPGNEKAVGAIHNNLARLGVDIITSDDALVHTSGHPRQGELKLLYEWLKPRAVVPVHGEPRHLRAQAAFARSCGIASAPYVENGDMVRLSPGPAEVIDEAPVGRLHVDEKLIVPSQDGPARMRRKLSYVGIVALSLVIDEKGSQHGDISLVTDGVPQADGDGRAIEDLLLDAAEGAFASMPKPRRRDDEAVAETLRSAVRRAAEALWGKKPVCKVLIHRI